MEDQPPPPDLRAEPTEGARTWKGKAPVVVCFGDRCFNASLRAVTHGLNTETVLTLAFALPDVSHAVPDLVGVMRVYRGGNPATPDEATLIFTGSLETLEWYGPEALVEASPMAGLKSIRMGGFYVYGLEAGEMFWTLVRIGGFSANSIRIGGPWPPPREKFFVVAPVEGVHFDFPAKVGDVSFTSDPNLRRQWKLSRDPPVGGPDYREEFLRTEFAAVTMVEHEFVYEAERIGLAKIEVAAARLAIAGRFSAAIGLDGRPRAFSRARLRERIRIRRVVGVLSSTSSRQWVRAVDTSQDAYVVTAATLLGTADGLRASIDDRTAEAMRSWHRAARASDSGASVIALAEALEFYAAGAAVPGLFTEKELEDLRDAAVKVARDDAQSRRVRDLVARANDAPFFVRLRAAIEADAANLTEAEFRLLRAMRDYRNDVLHGRQRVDPEPDQLTEAIALVGRLLLYRAARRSALA